MLIRVDAYDGNILYPVESGIVLHENEAGNGWEIRGIAGRILLSEHESREKAKELFDQITDIYAEGNIRVFHLRPEEE